MNWWIVAAALNGLVALLHLGIILGGPNWYRFFGAGDQLASMAERKHPWPGILTGIIALVFTSWTAICLSLAGILAPIPLALMAAWIITAIYTLRALAPLILMPWIKTLRTGFLFWSSIICGLFALVHGLAVISAGARPF